MGGKACPVPENLLTLRWKTYLLVGVTLLAAVLAVYVVSHTVFLRGFTSVEHAQMQDQVKRAQAAVAQNLAELDADCFSYASWDDTVAFLRTGDQSYIENNLPDSFYTGYKANLAVFVKTDGTIVYGKGYDLQKGRLTAMPAGLATYLTADGLLVHFSSVAGKTSGILMLPEGPMLVTSQPVLTSDGTGPAQGAVLLGRWLDADRVAGLAAQTLLTLNLFRADAAGLPADVRQAVASTGPSTTAIVAHPDTHTVAGYAVLDDVFGKPALVLRVSTPRDVYAQGSASVRYFIYALIGIVLVFGLAMSRVLERSVLSRLSRLTASVRGVRSGECKLNPIVLTGKDELSQLAQTIDSGFRELDSRRAKLELRQEELIRSEEHFRALIENSSDLIAVLDGEGILQFQSPSSERILGYRPQELQGRNIFDLVHPTDVSAARQALTRQVRREWEASLTLQTRVRHKDGSWRTLEMSARALDGPPGEPLCIVNSRDITERVKAEHALRESEEQLRQAQKMQAVGQLAGGIAHDFNNLLTAVIGNSDLVLQTLAPEDPNRELVADIKEVGERAAGLTRQILAFSRQQMLKPEVLCLNEVVTGLEPLLQRTLGEDVRVRAVLARDLDHVEVDPNQMGQVLMNLAVNARDAMPDGGELVIETANVDLDGAYCGVHAELKPGRHVLLAVSDNGSGMDEETRSRVFEPFFTTKEVGKGTGLGLSTVFGIVEQSGGSISVYSEPGKGSAFKVYLPAHGAAKVPEDDQSCEHMPQTGTETVLVVEDEAPVRQLLVRILSRSGYRVLDAASAAEIDGVLGTDEPVLDLLITDMVLPGGKSGREVAADIRERRPGVPVIFMSGYTRDSAVFNGSLGEDADFLEKPFTPGVLLEKVRAALDKGSAMRALFDLEAHSPA